MTSHPLLARLKLVFSFDLRSLALFRVMLAVLLLWDLALRSFDLSAFYTDDGVLPLEFWLSLNNQWHWSLHAASGTLWWQVLLFLLAACFAVGLLLGYRTRAMAFASFVLLASLLNRNTLILHGADILLVVMSFWALFLPIGARWSIDAALQPELRDNPNEQRFNPNAPQLHFSVATIAVVFQVLYLYFFTALLKTGDAWVTRFDAAFYAVSLEQFATPIAIWARQFPALFSLGTVYVIVVEFLAPLLVLMPFLWPKLRLLGVLLLASLHAGFLLMLHIGLFPLVDFMSLSVLIPSALWIAWQQHRQGTRSYLAMNKIIIHYDEDCGFCLKMCLVLREFLLSSSVSIVPAQRDPSIHAIMVANNSWVVQDHTGATYLHWHAMQLLFMQRWPFKPIGWFMGLAPFMALGNGVYRWVANNRDTMSRVTARVFPWRNLSLRPSVLGSVIAGFFFYAVTVYNVTGLPNNRSYRGDMVTVAISATRLNQRWDMFAPFPMTQSRYPQVPGKNRRGEAVNLFPGTDTDPNWQPPEYLVPVFGGYRWRKYMDRVQTHSNNTVRSSYGRYLCRTHNSGLVNKSPEQLATFEVWFVNRQTNTRGDLKMRRQTLSPCVCCSQLFPDVFKH